MHSELEQISNMKSKMLSLEEQHYKYMLKKNTDLRAFRHDYNYHITSMQALAQNNDFTALKAYVNNLTETKAKMYFISTLIFSLNLAQFGHIWFPNAKDSNVLIISCIIVVIAVFAANIHRDLTLKHLPKLANIEC